MKNLIVLVSIFGLTCGLALEGDWIEDQNLRENFADFIYNRLFFVGGSHFSIIEPKICHVILMGFTWIQLVLF